MRSLVDEVLNTAYLLRCVCLHVADFVCGHDQKCILFPWTLKMEAICSSEMSRSNRTTRRYNPEDCATHSDSRDNLRSNIFEVSDEEFLCVVRNPCVIVVSTSPQLEFH
jgi:hypothetical protein